MSGTSAAPMSLRTRMVPLVLLLFITSTIPLSPAVDATASRNLQDFQIVAPVEPFINGSYDLWETQSLIVDVRNNASTPIGGRQLKVSVCAGDHTAGNACPLNDGAAAVVVMSRKRAEELGITPLARIIASSVSALNPEIMGLGPIEAIKRVLARADMSMSDIDLVEINEAFAAQVIPSADELGIDMVDQLNVNGGAIALGHPFGQTGARIMTTLLNGLEDSDKTFGLESMCVGGGQGMAMIVERLN